MPTKNKEKKPAKKIGAKKIEKTLRRQQNPEFLFTKVEAEPAPAK